MKPQKSVFMSLLAASFLGVPLSAVPVSAWAETNVVQQSFAVKGVVRSTTGEPLMGAVAFVVGTKNSTVTDVNGAFSLKGVKKGATVRVSLVGFKTTEQKWTGGPLTFKMEELGNDLNEVVVTAMGIVRKEKSLTYATQQIKSDDIMKVQDANLVNSIEGKVSGVTITPGAGGAGGASKIQLRGAKSILGNNAPLIVIDGIPMTNNTRNQVSDPSQMVYSSSGEGSDPLSMVNPDDIESMNILKGANAAALYGSAAANGVIMITTKKGKEGKLDINFNSNVTFDKVLLTPKIQNIYGANVDGAGTLSINSWGAEMTGTRGRYTINAPVSSKFNPEGVENMTRPVHLRDFAENDIDEFFQTGVTTNNSVSLSGGTEKIRTYASFANAHANGMVENNSYNRNTLAFRQSFKFWNRVTFDLNANYVQTKTKNRVSGGTVLNPIYDLYTTPRNIDMDYYKNTYVGEGKWQSNSMVEYTALDKESGNRIWTKGYYKMQGPMQEWAYQSPSRNNPYFLQNMNGGEQREDRFYGSFQGKVDIYDGLAFQARVSIDHNKYEEEAHRYATTQLPSAMDDYGHYWLKNQRTSEIYTDYLLSYNKEIHDWSISATAGWVGHTLKSTFTNVIDADATTYRPYEEGWADYKVPINRFDASAGLRSSSSRSKSSDWDKAALFTAQIGWKDMVYVDGSYRRDWYRAFKQFEHRGTPDNYGYFGFGANAILSSLLKLPKWISYMKYRLSYSEVGNSIPNILYSRAVVNQGTGTVSIPKYNSFNAIPEKTKAFETGLEMQFFNNRLNADITYYNSAMHNSYLIIPGTNGKSQPVTTGVIRNQGIEMTVGYDWHITPDWRWKTSVNFSYNKNKIEKTYRNERGEETLIAQNLAGVQIKYIEGSEYGDMYVSDYRRWGQDVVDAQGKLLHKKGDIYINENGTPYVDGSTAVIEDGAVKVIEGQHYTKFIGNMNSKIQLGWSNTFSYKNFNLFFLINGRIGGKVISLTEGYLDNLGLSERTADLRKYAEANHISWTAPDGSTQPGMVIPGGVDQIAPIQAYHEYVSKNDPSRYVYSATNFRLRELSLGYTFRDLLGENKNLSLSVIGRNLFFIYKDSPVDPDVSLSTANGLGGFEVFNLPSARSFGINLKLNF